MAKRKYSFTDLSEDIIIQKPNEQEQTTITNKETKKDEANYAKDNLENKNENNHIENNINNQSNEEKYVSKYDIDINYDDEEPAKNITNINNQNTVVKPETSEKTSINEEQITNDSKKIISEKHESHKPLFQEKPIEERNTKTVIRTFNESLNYQSNNGDSNEFSNNPKANELFSSKEKLDVKTNIYLKPKLVFKIKELVDKTGESRSSVINKLIEFALEEMEK